MAITVSNVLVQDTLGTGNSVTTSNVSWIAGRTYIATGGTNGSGASINPSNVAGIVWTVIVLNSGDPNMFVAYGRASTTTSVGLTITDTGSGLQKWCIIDEITSASNSSVLTAFSSNTGTSNTSTLPSARGFHYVSRAVNNPVTITNEAGWTQIVSPTLSSRRQMTAYNITGDTTATATTTGTNQHFSVALAFSEALIVDVDSKSFTQSLNTQKANSNVNSALLALTQSLLTTASRELIEKLAFTQSLLNPADREIISTLPFTQTNQSVDVRFGRLIFATLLAFTQNTFNIADREIISKLDFNQALKNPADRELLTTLNFIQSLLAVDLPPDYQRRWGGGISTAPISKIPISTLQGTAGQVLVDVINYAQTNLSPTLQYKLIVDLLAFTQTMFGGIGISPTIITVQVLQFIQTLYGPADREIIATLAFNQILNNLQLQHSINATGLSFLQTNFNANALSYVYPDSVSFTQTDNTVNATATINPDLLPFAQSNESANAQSRVSPDTVNFLQTTFNALANDNIRASTLTISQQLNGIKANLIINVDPRNFTMALVDVFVRTLGEVTIDITVSWKEFEVTSTGVLNLVDKQASLTDFLVQATQIPIEFAQSGTSEVVLIWS